MAANIPTAAKLRWLKATLATSLADGMTDVAATWDREVLTALIADYEQHERREQQMKADYERLQKQEKLTDDE